MLGVFALKLAKFGNKYDGKICLSHESNDARIYKQNFFRAIFKRKNSLHHNIISFELLTLSKLSNLILVVRQNLRKKRGVVTWTYFLRKICSVLKIFYWEIVGFLTEFINFAALLLCCKKCNILWKLKNLQRNAKFRYFCWIILDFAFFAIITRQRT